MVSRSDAAIGAQARPILNAKIEARRAFALLLARKMARQRPTRTPIPRRGSAFKDAASRGVALKANSKPRLKTPQYKIKRGLNGDKSPRDKRHSFAV